MAEPAALSPAADAAPTQLGMGQAPDAKPDAGREPRGPKSRPKFPKWLRRERTPMLIEGLPRRQVFLRFLFYVRGNDVMRRAAGFYLYEIDSRKLCQSDSYPRRPPRRPSPFGSPRPRGRACGRSCAGGSAWTSRVRGCVAPVPDGRQREPEPLGELGLREPEEEPDMFDQRDAARPAEIRLRRGQAVRVPASGCADILVGHGLHASKVHLQRRGLLRVESPGHRPAIVRHSDHPPASADPDSAADPPDPGLRIRRLRRADGCGKIRTGSWILLRQSDLRWRRLRLTVSNCDRRARTSWRADVISF